MPPRAAAPAKHIDLSALRELANLSADSALSEHAHRVLVNAMRSKLIVAFVALASGAGLWWMWHTFGARETTLYASLAALLVSIFWGVEYAVLTGRLIVNKSGHLALRHSPGEEPHGDAENTERRQKGEEERTNGEETQQDAG